MPQGSHRLEAVGGNVVQERCTKLPPICELPPGPDFGAVRNAESFADLAEAEYCKALAEETDALVLEIVAPLCAEEKAEAAAVALKQVHPRQRRLLHDLDTLVAATEEPVRRCKRVQKKLQRISTRMLLPHQKQELEGQLALGKSRKQALQSLPAVTKAKKGKAGGAGRRKTEDEHKVTLSWNAVKRAV